MKYFEFNKHDYYAIIKAEDSLKACKEYQYYVAGESVEEVLEEGNPNEITALKALEVYGSTAPKGTPFTEVLDNFIREESLIVIDGNLA